MNSEHDTISPGDPDPVFINSRREAVFIFLTWLAAFAWSVPYCYLNGFRTLGSPEELELVMGLPSWVFWGVGMPWLVADLVTIWFCFFFMTDDDLEPAHSDSHSIESANGGAA